MPTAMWKDDEEMVNNRSTNLSGSRFSTRDYAVDQSVNLMAMSEDPVTNLSGANTNAGSNSGGGFVSSVAGLFRGTGASDAPPAFDEYGDAAPSAESEEYISGKTRRITPITAQIRSVVGTKTFFSFVLGMMGLTLLAGGIYLTVSGPSAKEITMKQFIIDEGISAEVTFEDENSPQSLALAWVTKRDPAKLKFDEPGAIDRYILAVFYYGSNVQQDGWKNSDNWLTGAGVCSWEGVQCIPKEIDGARTQSYDDNEFITGLLLPSHGIEGTVPREFSGFPELLTLDLSGNGLTGSLPPALGSMKKVRNLLLSNNSIFGTFPSEITQLTRLYQLDIAENQLSGVFPESMGLMSGLRNLYISSNEFEGFIPYVDTCQSLIRFHADNNRFSATLPVWLSRLTDLKDIRVSNNTLMGGIAPDLQSMSNLEILHLDHNQFKHTIPDIFNHLNRIEELQLDHNQFTGTIPSTLFDLEDLKIATFDNNKFSGSIVDNVGNLIDVEMITFHENHLDGSIPTQFGALDDIHTLSFNGNRFSGPIPSELGECFRLKTLTFDQNLLTGNIPKELGSLDRLEELRLGNNEFTGQVPSEVCDLKTKESLIYISADCEAEISCSCCNQCL